MKTYDNAKAISYNMVNLLYFTHTGMCDIDTDITLDSGVEMKKRLKIIHSLYLPKSQSFKMPDSGLSRRF